jgi:hypothetical protein
MITKQKFREIVGHCPKGFKIEFRKWSHMEEGCQPNLGYKGMPNLVSVREVDRFTRFNDIDGKKVTTVTFVDDFDEFVDTPENIISNFCGSDDGYIEFRLEVDEGNGKTHTIEMVPEVGDTGWSDRIMNIFFEEIN